MKVGIILPTFNEEENIGFVIDELRALGFDRIYVVDSKSKDNTTKIAKSKKVKIIEIDKKGKGIAIKEVFKKINDDVIVIIDADGSYDLNSISPGLKMLDKYDVIIGNRFKGGIKKGAMSLINKFGNKFLSFFASLLFNENIGDLCSGFWIMKKDVYKTIEIDSKHFELEANLFFEILKHNFKFYEIPVKYKKRKGKSKLSIIEGLKIFIYMISKRLKM